MKELLRTLISQGLAGCYADGSLSSGEFPSIIIEKPAHADHGDFATNVAMLLAKAEKKAPRMVAETLVSHLADGSGVCEKIEIAGPGFINFHLKDEAWRQTLLEVDQIGFEYGKSGVGGGKKIQVEFVSANPTGPLHIGHGRGAALGDTICRLLSATGWDVTREFYYNDAGQQIANLALSVQARCFGNGPDDPGWPSDGYQGEYIIDVARAYMARETVHADDQHVTAAGDPQDLEAIRRFAVAFLRREQDQDLAAFDVHFDVYSLESDLYADGSVERVVRRLVDSGHTYEQDDALWLRTTSFADDKDRVMRKSGGGYTYFVPDVAYHLRKWERGFTRVVNEQGADHHSTITRVRAGLQALDAGIPAGWPEYVLHQMVTVLRGGEEVKISKRAGSYVTLRDLIDEVGRDATRFFFVMRKPDSQLVFDIDLAKQKSLDNPVYYVQYAHARICSIFENAAEKGFVVPGADGVNLDQLIEPEEMAIVKALAFFPEVVEGSAANFEPHRIANYLQELAGLFHGFYNKNRVITEDSQLTAARLFLLKCVALTLKNALNLLGISAPEKM
ncbi:arginyl-tRNA synthetase [Geotalea daltonii FRC-32]|uniref:Arginine--tRNA ligase n=1 Tax=Geotalea daltonii (strain DSM 22248 / JCM 15807 / FRC-32) TaxID=316067 RepID=SYR_GEODF|nr:arginine--tRNA ligase [Geotalea daltonii]B9M2S2.1 RecName: Full=Arginine--tRNA ligase; AltName: Full=Arginyl-tRNA synthetase; Short=ArgRS [Geotalea daltonii FRC-32]ACM21268.1 arginyl-tRNA synthetase [Geotalea daltonii FRC-32]